ncbi:glycosyltransferase family 1 protein [Patescibacteria group bacterium]|nr:MAG: glycosyltransferase family 1 protein [Patescibacteria group bacterium]
MSLIILTKSPKAGLFSKEIYWRVLRRLAGVKRGPDAVMDSLLRGLDELKRPYLLNVKSTEIKPEDTVFVNGSLETLQWAIKERKKFKKLVAGPNLVVTPNDGGGIINAPEIDLILQPSDWVRDFYLSISPRLSEKIKVWPAGVRVPEITNNRREKILVFVKNSLSGGELQALKNALAALSYKFIIKRSERSESEAFTSERAQIKYPVGFIFYDDYKQADYFRELNQAKAMLYFSLSESQGLALQEAWARNVPTLVWDRGRYEYNNYFWCAKNISCPYLNERCGMTFADFAELPAILEEFLRVLKRFDPRAYVEEQLSDLRSAEKLLAIVGL